MSAAWRLNSASPSFRLIEFTIPLPCKQRNPASITLHLELSIITGTRAMSGSLAIRLRNFTIAAWLSSMASSMFTSTTCAPFSTCWRATASASSYWPFRIMRANAFEPVTLVRSPILMNRLSSPMTSGSRPASVSGREEEAQACMVRECGTIRVCRKRCLRKKANQAADHRARFAVVRGLGFLWQTWHMCIGPFIGRVSVFAARLNNVMGVGFI